LIFNPFFLYLIEGGQVRKIPFAKLFDMVDKGEVTDAITIAAVYKTKLLIDSGAL
jgi:hypothetical protein